MAELNPATVLAALEAGDVDWNQTDQQIADAWNDPAGATAATYKPITSDVLLEWAAATGTLLAIKTALANQQTPDIVRVLCDAADIMIRRDSTTLNLNKPSVTAMVAGLVQAGVISEQASAALYALAAQPVSKAVKSIGQSIAYWDVARARALKGNS